MPADKYRAARHRPPARPQNSHVLVIRIPLVGVLTAAYNNLRINSQLAPMSHRLRHLTLPALLTVTLVLFAFGVPRPASAQHSTASAPHVIVSLLVPPAQIAPGENLAAGLVFKLEEGWHVYWINAGDSGEPPAIKWTLPAGVTADAMQFPPPKRLGRASCRERVEISLGGV